MISRFILLVHLSLYQQSGLISRKKCPRVPACQSVALTLFQLATQRRSHRQGSLRKRPHPQLQRKSSSCKELHGCKALAGTSPQEAAACSYKPPVTCVKHERISCFFPSQPAAVQIADARTVVVVADHQLQRAPENGAC